jgi:hypothetical protein
LKTEIAALGFLLRRHANLNPEIYWGEKDGLRFSPSWCVALPPSDLRSLARRFATTFATR